MLERSSSGQPQDLPPDLAQVIPYDMTGVVNLIRSYNIDADQRLIILDIVMTEREPRQGEPLWDLNNEVLPGLSLVEPQPSLYFPAGKLEEFGYVAIDDFEGRKCYADVIVDHILDISPSRTILTSVLHRSGFDHDATSKSV